MYLNTQKKEKREKLKIKKLIRTVADSQPSHLVYSVIKSLVAHHLILLLPWELDERAWNYIFTADGHDNPPITAQKSHPKQSVIGK